MGKYTHVSGNNNQIISGNIIKDSPITQNNTTNDKKKEALDLLKEALSKLDEIKDEDKKALAKIYLKQTIKDVDSANIDKEDIEERRSFFEKLKPHGFKIVGLALSAIEVIQNFF